MSIFGTWPPIDAPAAPKLLGWVKVSAAGAILAQSAENIVASVDAWAGNISNVNLVPGTQAAAAQATDFGTSTPSRTYQTDVSVPTIAQVRGADLAGAPQTGNYWLTIYSS